MTDEPIYQTVFEELEINNKPASTGPTVRPAAGIEWNKWEWSSKVNDKNKFQRIMERIHMINIDDLNYLLSVRWSRDVDYFDRERNECTVMRWRRHSKEALCKKKKKQSPILEYVEFNFTSSRWENAATLSFGNHKIAKRLFRIQSRLGFRS